MAFELLGSNADEIRLLRAPAIGYSIALAGRPRVVSVPTDGAAYDVVLALGDVEIEHGFRIDAVPSHPDPSALAMAIVTAYRNQRAKKETRVRKLSAAMATPGVIAGAQSIYGLKHLESPTMEHLWVAIHPAPHGLYVLYHTTRFRNADVNTIVWGHVRSSFIDQHSWDPQRSEAPVVWPPSEIARPSVRLELTDAAMQEAREKASELGAITADEQARLMSVFREFAQQDYPPRMPINELLRDTVRSGINSATSNRVASVCLRGLDSCKTRHDLHGWIWGCVWAIGEALHSR